MHSRKITLVEPLLAVPLLVVPLLLTSCDRDAAAKQKVQQERAAIATAESTAVRVAALPATGLWSKEHLLERLVRSGVAPREVSDAPTGPTWMGRRALVIAAGGGEVYAWIYADSSARKAATDPLDEATGAPKGANPAFAGPMVFVRQNNLAAMITGGSETNQDRIALALQAGVPAVKP